MKHPAESTGSPDSPDSPIDAYLDDLFARLPRHDGQLRRVLAEVEDHLRDSAAAGEAAGLQPEDAERTAVARFGAPDLVAAGFRPRFSPWRLGVDLVRTAWTLAAVGLLAIGVSGVVAAFLDRLVGPSSLGGSASAAGRSLPDCVHLLRVQPGAGTCAQAAVLETADDAVFLRLLAGALGLLLLVALRLVRRRLPESVLPSTFAPTVAVCAFGGAAALLFACATHVLAVDPQPVGAGFFLSGAAVAAVAALGYSGVLLKRLVRVPVR